MVRAERILLYTVLTALLLAVFGRVLPSLSTPAAATAPSMNETLGPADELILNGTDGDLTLSNKDGRVAWGDKDTARVWSIGAVSLSAIMKELLSRESFQEEFAELQETAQTQAAEFEAQFQALQDEYGEIQPNDPKFAEAQGRAQAIQNSYQNWQQQTQKIRGKMLAEQTETAYREAVDAVEVVADKQNIDVVYRFIPTAEEFKSDSPGHAAEQIRLRTFLRYPEQIDLTPAVLDELGL